MVNMELPLSPYKVLDLTDEKGLLCGKILADLGADVIKVEKVGGDQSRAIGPFYKNDPHPERSLFWFAYNTGKRSITLNLESFDGQLLFRKLVRRTDWVLESFSPGYLDTIGLGYNTLSKDNPGLILTSITPWGQTGPYKNYQASDLIIAAMSGQMYRTGFPSREPLRIGIPQVYVNAAIQATTGLLIANHYRQRTGKGQHVDVGAFEVFLHVSSDATMVWESTGQSPTRVGTNRISPAVPGGLRQLWSCKDGYVMFMLTGGARGQKTNEPLVKWMASEGMVDNLIQGVEWGSLDMYTVEQTTVNHFNSLVAEFFLKHTKNELYMGALERRIMLYPVNDPVELLDSVQLKDREFWTEIEHPELNATITYPGPFAKSTENFCRVKKRAPMIGEHNLEVYMNEIGLTKIEIASLKESGII